MCATPISILADKCAGPYSRYTCKSVSVGAGVVTLRARVGGIGAEETFPKAGGDGVVKH